MYRYHTLANKISMMILFHKIIHLYGFIVKQSDVWQNRLCFAK